MASDSECREVARRLRSVDVNDILFDSELVDAIEHACGSKRKRRDFGKIIERLADLIEPSEGQDEPDVSVDRDRGTERGRSPDTCGQCPKSCPKMSGIDRDALLALSDKMQIQQYMREDARWLRWDEAARRIREALGDDNAR